MNKPNSEHVTIDVIVNFPRLASKYSDPIEAIIRTYDGAIIHNLFAENPTDAAYQAIGWVNRSQFYESSLPVRYWPEIAIFEQTKLVQG